MKFQIEILTRIEILSSDMSRVDDICDLQRALTTENLMLLDNNSTNIEPQRINYTDYTLLEEINTYMCFAICKAVEHNDLSSNRSIGHYKAWIWLLNDGNYDKIDWDDYTNYGCPILLKIIALYNIPFPYENSEYSVEKGDREIFYTMAKGQICPNCLEGYTSGCRLEALGPLN